MVPHAFIATKVGNKTYLKKEPFRKPFYCLLVFKIVENLS